MSYTEGVSSPLSPPSRNVPLAVQVGAQLRAQVASGSWPVGTKIPGEHELVELFGTSRNTVREALRGLVHAGLLEARPGDGTYVRATDELEVALHRRIENERTEDVYEVREALEVHAARVVAGKAGKDIAAQLDALLDERDAAPSKELYVERDVIFHRTLVAATGNPLFTDLYNELRLEPTIVAGRTTPGAAFSEPSDFNGIDDPHRAIVAAIRVGDGEAAADAAAALISRSRNAQAAPPR